MILPPKKLTVSQLLYKLPSTLYKKPKAHVGGTGYYTLTLRKNSGYEAMYYSVEHILHIEFDKTPDGALNRLLDWYNKYYVKETKIEDTK